MNGDSFALASAQVPPPIHESQVRHAVRVARYRFLETASPLRSPLIPRRFHAYHLSIGKSASHSVYGMFRKTYRAAHEPYAQIALDVNYGWRLGKLSDSERRAFLMRRDRALWLELEASPFLLSSAPQLVELFPKAQFVVTLRDCYSWLNSIINFSLETRSTVRHARERVAYFGKPQFDYAPEENLLRERGLFSLDGYLSYWATENQKLLDVIPCARRLVIRAHELAAGVVPLARFLNIASSTLDASQAHLFRTGTDYGILRQIDPSFLEHKIQTHCRDLMTRYFPEIRTLEDALPPE